jgi:DNA-binding NarL/FixJ family response regulator
MIADSLFVSEQTVHFHIKNIYQKLQVHSKSEAVAKALHDKLV